LRVPDGSAARLRSHVGREVTLGMRPEDLRVANSADPAGCCFDAVVEVVEQLGSEILLDVSVGNATMVAAVDPSLRTKVDEKLRLAVNPDRLHFFDVETEAAI